MLYKPKFARSLVATIMAAFFIIIFKIWNILCRLLELAPRRTSNRVLQKIKQQEEDVKQSEDQSTDTSREEGGPSERLKIAREIRARRRILVRLIIVYLFIFRSIRVTKTLYETITRPVSLPNFTRINTYIKGALSEGR